MTKRTGGSWGIGQRRAKKHIHYRVLCSRCGAENIITKAQYTNQLKFKCLTCKKLSRIDPLLSERILY